MCGDSEEEDNAQKVPINRAPTTSLILRDEKIIMPTYAGVEKTHRVVNSG